MIKPCFQSFLGTLLILDNSSVGQFFTQIDVGLDEYNSPYVNCAKSGNGRILAERLAKAFQSAERTELRGFLHFINALVSGCGRDHVLNSLCDDSYDVGINESLLADSLSNLPQGHRNFLEWLFFVLKPVVDENHELGGTIDTFPPTE
ncbi:MAG: hypothetical protein HOA17_00430 [Candidatus Melainabacteria bacterium]|nr:hypothetical protein [Candidatus Melainabacteria bacterium]